MTSILFFAIIIVFVALVAGAIILFTVKKQDRENEDILDS